MIVNVLPSNIKIKSKENTNSPYKFIKAKLSKPQVIIDNCISKRGKLIERNQIQLLMKFQKKNLNVPIVKILCKKQVGTPEYYVIMCAINKYIRNKLIIINKRSIRPINVINGKVKIFKKNPLKSTFPNWK